MDTTWTDSRVKQLLRLQKEGLSGSEIAAIMQGVSRNAVIGKLNRLGVKQLPARAPRPARISGYDGAIVHRMRQRIHSFLATPDELKAPGIIPPEPPPAPNITTARGVGRAALAALRAGDCRWPIGEVGTEDFRFCGAPRERRSVYCAHHHAVAKGVSRHVEKKEKQRSGRFQFGQGMCASR